MDLFDSVIIGGGPSGLSAAIYLARAQYRVLVIEKEDFGGQITITSEVVNYPGVISTDGRELTDNMRKQAESFGAEFMKAEVTGLNLHEDIKKINLRDGRTIESIGLVLALGASPRKAGFEGEGEYIGRGVAYCATCDGEFFTGQDIFVIGGGFAAVEEAMFLTKYGRSVNVIVRGNEFNCAKSASDKLMEYDNANVMFNTKIKSVGGDPLLRYAILENIVTGEETRYEADEGSTFGIFVFTGRAPATELIKGTVDLNASGYIICDANQKTNIDGVYGAGDVCVKNLRQVVTAVSDGAVAATELEKYISDMYYKLKLPPRQPLEKPVKSKSTQSETPQNSDGSILDGTIKDQLTDLFSKLDKRLEFHAILDDRNVSLGIKEFLEEISNLSPYLSCSFEQGEGEGMYPEIRMNTQEGYSGISFHALPGGHELNSFVIAAYNLAGPGQPIEDSVKERIKALKPTTLTIGATLTCTMCPELVMASQRIASLNPDIQAHMVDINLFPEFKSKYKIMSVPALIIDEDTLKFGKKNVIELLEILEGM